MKTLDIVAFCLYICRLPYVVLSSRSDKISIPTVEFEALRSLYTSLGGSVGRWTNSYGWGNWSQYNETLVHPCSWYGVSCNKTSSSSSSSPSSTNDTRVVSLKLSGNNLAGNLSGSILSEFLHLHHLDFGINDLVGTLPSELCTFGSNLIILSFWKNSLSGKMHFPFFIHYFLMLFFLFD
jgi:hypothetical protein